MQRNQLRSYNNKEAKTHGNLDQVVGKSSICKHRIHIICWRIRCRVGGKRFDFIFSWAYGKVMLSFTEMGKTARCEHLCSKRFGVWFWWLLRCPLHIKFVVLIYESTVQGRDLAFRCVFGSCQHCLGWAYLERECTQRRDVLRLKERPQCGRPRRWGYFE